MRTTACSPTSARVGFVDTARAVGGDDSSDSRGVAIADLDLDGRLDIAINNNNARPSIYLNRFAETGNWLRLELVGGDRSNRDAVGARVRVTTLSADGRMAEMTRWVEAGSGFASQSAFPVHFGLGEAERLAVLEIEWPSGRVERLAGAELAARIPGVNRTVRLEESMTLASRPVGAAGRPDDR